MTSRLALALLLCSLPGIAMACRAQGMAGDSGSDGGGPGDVAAQVEEGGRAEAGTADGATPESSEDEADGDSAAPPEAGGSDAVSVCLTTDECYFSSNANGYPDGAIHDPLPEGAADGVWHCFSDLNHQFYAQDCVGEPPSQCGFDAACPCFYCQEGVGIGCNRTPGEADGGWLCVGEGIACTHADPQCF